MITIPGSKGRIPICAACGVERKLWSGEIRPFSPGSPNLTTFKASLAAQLADPKYVLPNNVAELVDSVTVIIKNKKRKAT